MPKQQSSPARGPYFHTQSSTWQVHIRQPDGRYISRNVDSEAEGQSLVASLNAAEAPPSPVQAIPPITLPDGPPTPPWWLASLAVIAKALASDPGNRALQAFSRAFSGLSQSAGRHADYSVLEAQLADLEAKVSEMNQARQYGQKNQHLRSVPANTPDV